MRAENTAALFGNTPATMREAFARQAWLWGRFDQTAPGCDKHSYDQTKHQNVLSAHMGVGRIFFGGGH